MAFTQNEGAQIYWEEQGSGDPLLLIMGLGYTSRFWHRTAPVLAEHYRVILFDNRGVGLSDVPDGPYPISLMASDAAAVLDAASIERAHIFGISMGGMIAQEFALNYPHRVNDLILGCTAFGGKNAVRAEPEVVQLIWDRARMTAEEAFWAMAPYVYDPSTPRERIEEDFEIRKQTYPTDKGYLAQVNGIFAWESYDRLPLIVAPTLVLHGLSDRLVPPGNGELISERIAGAKLVMLPRASHMFFTDQPIASNLAVLDFLKGRAD
jgi:pimeloyl-ACP methyl ester carboxylesterase